LIVVGLIVCLPSVIGVRTSGDEAKFDELCEEGHYDAALQFINEALRQSPDRRSLHERKILLSLSSANPEAPSVSASAWREMQAREIQSSVFQTAMGHPLPVVRRNAAQAIELLRYSPARGALEKRVQDSDPDVRTAVVAALGSICKPGDVPFFSLALALRDPDWRVRAEAASGLGRAGDSRAVPHLIRNAADPDEYVRSHAREALIALAQPGSAMYLAKALRDASGTRAEGSIALALAKAGDPEGFQRVELIMKDRASDERRDIARALTEIDSKAAGRLFSEMMNEEPDAEIKRIMLECVAGNPDGVK
jgi:hypothetical protein